jgi:hypothetical protein
VASGSTLDNLPWKSRWAKDSAASPNIPFWLERL